MKSNLQDVIRQIWQVEKSVRKAVLADGLRAAGKVIERQVKAAAPVRTGAMRRSIQVRLGRGWRDDARKVFVWTKADNLASKAERRVGFYPAQVEFGWTPGRLITSRTTRRHIKEYRDTFGTDPASDAYRGFKKWTLDRYRRGSYYSSVGPRRRRLRRAEMEMIRRIGKGPKIPGQHFMERAANAAFPAAVKTFGNILAAALRGAMSARGQ